jgi:hypothetical protein
MCLRCGSGFLLCDVEPFLAGPAKLTSFLARIRESGRRLDEKIRHLVDRPLRELTHERDLDRSTSTDSRG